MTVRQPDAQPDMAYQETLFLVTTFESRYQEKELTVCLPVQAATGGRSGVSVYKAGRSVPLDSAQLDLSRLALPQLGSAGVEKCFEIHVPSSGLKTNKKQKRSKNTFHE